MYDLRTRKWRTLSPPPGILWTHLRHVHQTPKGRFVLASVQLKEMHRFDPKDDSFVRLDGGASFVGLSTRAAIFSGNKLLSWGAQRELLSEGGGCPPYAGDGPVCDPAPPTYNESLGGVLCAID